MSSLPGRDMSLPNKRRVTMLVLNYIRRFRQIPPLSFIKSKFPYLRIHEINNIV